MKRQTFKWDPRYFELFLEIFLLNTNLYNKQFATGWFCRFLQGINEYYLQKKNNTPKELPIDFFLLKYTFLINNRHRYKFKFVIQPMTHALLKRFT